MTCRVCVDTGRGRRRACIVVKRKQCTRKLEGGALLKVDGDNDGLGDNDELIGGKGMEG